MMVQFPACNVKKADANEQINFTNEFRICIKVI